MQLDCFMVSIINDGLLVFVMVSILIKWKKQRDDCVSLDRMHRNIDH